MPTPVREQVLAAIKVKLAAIAGIAGLVVERNRDAEVQSFPTLVIVDGDMAADNSINSASTQYEMEVIVEGYVVASEYESLGMAVSTLQAEVVKALTADYTLGGIAFDINEMQTSVDVNRNDGQSPAAFFATVFIAQFHTKQGDPYTVGP